MSGSQQAGGPCPVRRVRAIVRLRGEAERQAMLRHLEAQPHEDCGPWSRAELVRELRSRANLEVGVRLSAEDDTGRRIEADGEFGLSGPRRGLGAIRHRYRGRVPTPILRFTYRVGRVDIEDGINQMLGRDRDQHRPPRLAWGGLISALDRAGILASEEQLIAIPLEVELDDDVQAELHSWRAWAHPLRRAIARLPVP